MKKLLSTNGKWIALAIVSVAVVALVVGLVLRNHNKRQGDEKVVAVAEETTIEENEAPKAAAPSGPNTEEPSEAEAEIVSEEEEDVSAPEESETSAVTREITVATQKTTIGEERKEPEATNPAGDENVQNTGNSGSTPPQQPADTSETELTKEEYFEQNSEVVRIIDAFESEDVPNEQEVTELLSERGFLGRNITYEFAMGGLYVKEKAITGDPEQKRPMYQTYYMSSKGELWTVFVINGSVYANPVSYNLESTHNVQLLVSETEEITSYDYKTNKFYVTIPHESAVIIKTIERIDAQTLDSISSEEIDDL